MKKILITLATLIISAGLVGSSCSRQDTGMVAGGVVGGAAGYALTDSALGGVVGGLGGAYVGRQLAK